MSKETEELVKLFTTRNQIQGFMDKLELLKNDGSVPEEHYGSAKREYDQRLSAIDSEIVQIKDMLKKQLETLEKDIEISSFELDRLDTKYKVGELPESRYQDLAGKMNNNIEGLKRSVKDLTGFIQAKSLTDVGQLNPKPEYRAQGLNSIDKIKDITGQLSGLLQRTKGVVSDLLSKINEFAVARNVKVPRKSLPFAAAGILVVLIVVVVIVLVGTSSRVMEIKLPINIQGAKNVGSLHLELIYDKEALTPVSVQRGALLGDELFNYTIDTPGDVIMGMVSNKGINGDGPLALITFRTTGKAKVNTVLSLENTAAYDSNTLQEMQASATPGSFKPNDGSFVSPIIQLITR